MLQVFRKVRSCAAGSLKEVAKVRSQHMIICHVTRSSKPLGRLALAYAKHPSPYSMDLEKAKSTSGSEALARLAHPQKVGCCLCRSWRADQPWV